jgi:hypothetical protein
MYYHSLWILFLFLETLAHSLYSDAVANRRMRESCVHFAVSSDELLPLQPPVVEASGTTAAVDDDDDDDDSNDYWKRQSTSFHLQAITENLVASARKSLLVRRTKHLGRVICSLIGVLVLLVGASVGALLYYRVFRPAHRHALLEEAIRVHAAAARERAEQCRGYDWKRACDGLGPAGARRQRRRARKMDTEQRASGSSGSPLEREEKYLASDDPTVTFDSNCLRVYRLQLRGNITFPYHASQLLSLGGNFTMALFIQHGAMRNAEDYFCSFKELMMEQHYRDFEDILIIAPDFNYEHDYLVYPNDAFWNSSKPWGDWRVGAESDPGCCGNHARSGPPLTISSFEVLDNLLAILTNKRLFPRMDKVSYVGHSAGM